MKIELNKESAVEAIIAAIRNTQDENPTVYVDCNGKCYTEENRPVESYCLTAECWRYVQFWQWDEKLCKEVKLTREELIALPGEELCEIIEEEVREIDVDKALSAILDREDEMYNNVLWEYDQLPESLLHKIKGEFDFLRQIAGDWDTCRAQEEKFPFCYNCDDVECLMQNATVEKHTFESIVSIFNDAEKQLLESAKSVSDSIYKASLNNLLVEWEYKEIDDTMMHFYGIEGETVYLFTVNY